MFDGIRRVFRFLRPVQTQETLRPRKPMATPLPVATDHLALCELMMKRLEAAEAEVVSDIADPSIARQFMNEIHRLKLLTQSNLDELRPSSPNTNEPTRENPWVLPLRSRPCGMRCEAQPATGLRQDSLPAIEDGQLGAGPGRHDADGRQRRFVGVWR